MTNSSSWNFNDKLYEDVLKEGNWRRAVIQELKQSVSLVHMAKKDLKYFTKLYDNFDYKMSDGVSARCSVGSFHRLNR